ncbi:RNA 2',3'-cyclic phosphodiesterase [Chloroflexota bacterium]|nr:RNA 2',3'-cyclic phosphodiesterase [Chloroflexota bacterium]
MPRIFIAIRMPDEVIQKITQISQYFQSQLPEKALKWVETENLHLTLKFLGEIPEASISQVQELLTQVTAAQKSFELSVEGLGMYPHAEQPRTIWLGVKGAKPMISLHGMLENALEDIKIEKENRPFNPHLTLGRVRERTSREVAHHIGETLAAFKVDSLGTFQVSQVHLIESLLTPQGPIYTTRFTAPLSEV